MFDKLFGRRKQAFTATPSTGGRLVYAVGDIHGRLDLLDLLLEAVVADMEAMKPPDRPILVFLGDYVDRGADSAGVVTRILQVAATEAFEVRALKGNHEEALLQFLSDPTFGQTWTDYGGAATLASYGVTPPLTRLDPAAWEQARAAFDAALPATHRRFYETLELTVEVGDFLFVHAGVRPGVPIAEQSERDLLWIRGEFLNSDSPFGKMVVHGHTPTEEPQIMTNRMGLDTGAYATGVLTAARLTGAGYSLIQARLGRAAAAA